MTAELVVSGISDPSTLAVLARARKFKQYEKAVENALKGICPFCQIDWTYNEKVAENEHWWAWHSKPAEKNTRLHFLFVPKRHVKSSAELNDEEISALWGTRGIRHEVQVMYSYESCGTMMRDGDATLSAGTIQHLHIHDMVPDGKGRCESPFFKGAESEAEGVRRAIVFEKMRTGTPFESLIENDKALVQDRM